MADQLTSELSTRDVFLQVDRRLSLIEEDLRGLDKKTEILEMRLGDQIGALRSEMGDQIGSLRSELIGQLDARYSELTGQLGSLRSETNTRLECVNTRIDEVYIRLDSKIDTKFHQLVGILLASWVTLAGLVWFK